MGRARREQAFEDWIGGLELRTGRGQLLLTNLVSCDAYGHRLAPLLTRLAGFSENESDGRQAVFKAKDPAVPISPVNDANGLEEIRAISDVYKASKQGSDCIYKCPSS